MVVISIIVIIEYGQGDIFFSKCCVYQYCNKWGEFL